MVRQVAGETIFLKVKSVDSGGKKEVPKKKLKKLVVLPQDLSKVNAETVEKSKDSIDSNGKAVEIAIESPVVVAGASASPLLSSNKRLSSSPIHVTQDDLT